MCARRRDLGLMGTRDRRRRDPAAAAGRRGPRSSGPAPLHISREMPSCIRRQPDPDPTAARTSRTIINAEMLRLHLQDIVSRGYALDDEENDPGVRCISAPVFNEHGEPIGCIGIDGPSVRITEAQIDSLAENVVEAAKRLSNRIGEQAPATSCRTPHDQRADPVLAPRPRRARRRRQCVLGEAAADGSRRPAG